MGVASGGESLEGSAIELRTSLRKRLRNMDVTPQKKRPPISPAWIHPGLVTGGARSRNHKKTRLNMTHVGHISWTEL
jgi:hypothetical protein